MIGIPNLDVDIKEGFRLEEWEVYPELNRVVTNQNAHTLEGKIMTVLVELAKQPLIVVKKNALLDAVWPNQNVGDGVLTRAIHELRQVLGDTATGSRFIETVPRRGYRLICKPGPIESGSKTLSSRRALVGAVLLTVAAIAYWVGLEKPASSVEIQSVAVLPFANLTGSPTKDYIGDGLAEAVIHSIAQQPNLEVTARTSSFALRDSGMTAEDIGKRLGVDKIIEGSIREERGVQRITIQLIDSRTGRHDSSVTLDVIGGDLFNAQARISQTIEHMLTDAGAQIVADAIGKLPATVDRAYDLLLKGRAALHNRSAESLRNARAYFEEALRLDRNFAAAHAGMAQFYLVSRVYLQADPQRSRTLAAEASNAALELDPGNVDALMVAAAVAGDDGDFETSVMKFERSIELQPSNAQAHQWYGEMLTRLGLVAAGRDSIETALQLNPLAGSTNSVRAKAATFFLDDDRLLQTAKQGNALGARMAPRELSIHYFRVGDTTAYGREIGRYHEVVGVDADAAGLLVAAMNGTIGRTELIDQLAPLAEPADNFFSRELALLGMHEEALDGMLRGTATGSAFMSDIWLPEFAGVRALPDFVEFVESMDLDSYWRTHGMPDVCRQTPPETFCSQMTH